MTDINTNNLIKISDGVAVAGQRVIVINGVAHASGLGGKTAPTGGSSEDNALDLSFITAAAGDILSGKVGADREGNPVYGTLVPAQGGGAGGFDLAKVTQYTPATEAYSALSQIVISELGYIGDEEYDEGGDYSSANGTYFPTPGTAYETDPIKRVYKHESADWYIWCAGYRNDEGYVEEPWWYLGPTPDSGAVEILDDGVYDNDGELDGGTVWLMESDWGYESMCRLTVTKVNYPKADMVLKGVMVAGYENSQWSFDEAETDFIGFETTPRISNIYALAGSSLIGAPVSNAARNDFSTDSALFALDSWRGLNELVSGTVPTGYKSDANSVLVDGVFCFDHTRALQYQIGDSLSALTDFTIEMDYTITSDDHGSGYYGFFGNRTWWTTDCICVQWRRNGFRPSLHWNGVADDLTGGDEHREWVNDGKYHHVAVVRSDSTVYLFSDGKLLGTANGASNPLNLAAEGFLTVGVQRVENDILPGRMKHFRVVPFAMYTADFSNNIPTWVGA